jgi:hypothetical protein
MGVIITGPISDAIRRRKYVLYARASQQKAGRKKRRGDMEKNWKMWVLAVLIV